MIKSIILTVAVTMSLLVPSFKGTAATFVSSQSDEISLNAATQESPVTDEGEISNATSAMSSEQARLLKQKQKAEQASKYDSSGAAITIIAMGIVVGALVILSILFMIFGKISSKMLSRKKKEAHGVTDTNAEDHHDELDSGEVIAAIGMALAEHFGQGHDIEDTILTIKRMRKAYSPWNSKIYNLRHLPERPAPTGRPVLNR